MMNNSGIVKRLDMILMEHDYHELTVTEGLSLKAGSVLVICAGFEERSINSLRRAIDAGSSGVYVIVVDYLPYVKANKSEEIISLCGDAGFDYKLITYNRGDPAGGASGILNILPDVFETLYVDISGMSRLLIVQMMREIICCNLQERVSLLYSVAEEYFPTKETYDKESTVNGEEREDPVMFISSGVLDMSIIPELSSVSQQGQPIRLVVFPSFNPSQMSVVNSAVQPSHYTVINGIPPDERYSWRQEAIRQLNRLESLLHSDERSTSTLDYRETIRELLRIYDSYGCLERIIISPTGSKMQSVAVGIVRAYLNDIQIVYPTPRVLHIDEYTTGAIQLYELQLSGLPKVIAC